MVHNACSDVQPKPQEPAAVVGMNPETLRENLQRTRLSKYQADAYVTLVELGTASAVSISNACDVPQARIYDVLRDLEGMGYVETYERDSLHARAQNPDQVIDDLKNQAESAIEAAEEIERRWEQPSIENHRVNIVNRFETVVERAREYVADAEGQILFAATVEQFLTLADDLADAVYRDVVVKVSLSPQAPDDTVDVDRASERLEDAAVEARIRSHPAPFVLLVDRVGVCFAPEVLFHPSNEYGMVINDYSLGQVFKWYFESALWESWAEIYSSKPDDPPIAYTSIRTCINDVKTLIEANHTVVVRVHGRDRTTGKKVEFTGKVSGLGDASHRADSDRPESALATVPEHAMLTLDTGTEYLSVGGWGAIMEDIEADRLIVEAID